MSLTVFVSLLTPAAAAAASGSLHRRSSSSSSHAAARRRRRSRPLALPHLLDATGASLHATTALAAVLGGSSVAAIATAALSLSDPDRRRRRTDSDDKDAVREYFTTTGFDRWRKIYGDSGGLNQIQLDVRLGHSMTIEIAMEMVRGRGPLAGVSVCDAGCGTGSLAIPLAMEGAVVTATDISPAMVQEARRRAAAADLAGDASMPRFEVGDLDGLEGKWDTVVCLDVLIHYRRRKAEEMIERLASVAERRILISFAPWTAFFAAMKMVGEIFPGAAKATRAYLHAEAGVEMAIRRAGWRVSGRRFVGTRFYFAVLLEAVPGGSAVAGEDDGPPAH